MCLTNSPSRLANPSMSILRTADRELVAHVHQHVSFDIFGLLPPLNFDSDYSKFLAQAPSAATFNMANLINDKATSVPALTTGVSTLSPTSIDAPGGAVSGDPREHFAGQSAGNTTNVVLKRADR